MNKCANEGHCSLDRFQRKATVIATATSINPRTSSHVKTQNGELKRSHLKDWGRGRRKGKENMNWKGKTSDVLHETRSLGKGQESESPNSLVGTLG